MNLRSGLIKSCFKGTREKEKPTEFAIKLEERDKENGKEFYFISWLTYQL
jgi:hypothetical protein